MKRLSLKELKQKVTKQELLAERVFCIDLHPGEDAILRNSFEVNAGNNGMIRVLSYSQGCFPISRKAEHLLNALEEIGGTYAGHITMEDYQTFYEAFMIHAPSEALYQIFEGTERELNTLLKDPQYEGRPVYSCTLLILPEE